MKLNRFNWLLSATALVTLMGLLLYRPHSNSNITLSHNSIPSHQDGKAAVQSQATLPTLTPAQRTATVNAYAKLPLSFEENKGQTDARVKYVARGSGYSLYLMPNEAVLALRKSKSAANDATSVLRMKLADANPSSTIHGDEALAGKSNYFVGNKPSNFATDVSQFKKVRCENVYDGIDMVYYGNQRQLEYDFVVAPGANPKSIRMAFTGSNKIAVGSEGDLTIHVGDSDVKQHKPVIYQNIGGERKIVAGHYEIVAAAKSEMDETVVGFNISDYDRSAPLVIDPVLIYATYFGDKPNTDHSGDDIGLAIAIDASGAAYVVGTTTTYEFPLAGQIQTVIDPINHATITLFHSLPENYHGFITKFMPDGSGIVFSSYLAGSGTDVMRGVVVDATGNVYICGSTTSSDFPIKNAQHAYSGGMDAVLLKLNPAGSNIVFSTYLGGSGDDTANDIALDPSGNVVIVGTTASTNFVSAHPVQATFGGVTDAFVASFTSDGAINNFTTFLGGSLADTGNGIAIDSSGNIYVTGSTASLDFPIARPYQVQKGAGKDAFVTKLNSSGSLLVFSTYLGGDGDDIGNGIAVDVNGNIYVTGSTASTNFPTISPTVLPIQSVNGGPAGTTDAFVSKFNVTGSALIFSTYLGGTMNDVGLRVRIDSRNAIYVSGTTTLTNGATAAQNTFPSAPATNTLQPGHSGNADGFLAKFNPTGTPLVYSTYIGSDVHAFVTENGVQNANAPTNVNVNGMAVDNTGNAFITGSTDGSFYYTFGAYCDVSPLFPSPGEDFPAKHKIEQTDSQGNVIAYPAEKNTSLNIDDRDVIIAKIGDSSPIITSPMLAQAILGVPFSGYVITATNSPQSFDAAGLPPGLSVSTTGGQISGTPTQNGVFNVVITATNQSGTGSQILTISVSSAKPNITNALSATANVGSVFQFTLTANNNPGSFALTALAPTVSLPVGLSLDAITGLISGVPVVEGNYTFNATATNASGTSLPQSFSINVLPAIPVISSPVNVQAVLNTPFSYAITGTGNPQSYNCTPNVSTSGNIITLAIGLQLNTQTGYITGTPNTLGFYKFVVSATNAGGTGSQAFNLTIIPALVPNISSSSNTTGIYNEPFSFQITASNSPLAFGVLPVGGLPAGLSLDNQTGIISGTITPPVNLPVISAATQSGTTVTITTSVNHGLSVGQTVVVSNIGIAGYNGVYTITAVPFPNQFQYVDTNSILPPDIKGGLTSIINASASGATEAGNVVTVTTNAPHGFSVGETVVTSGFNVAGYNGTFTINGTPTATSFTYIANFSALAAAGAGNCVATSFTTTPISASASGSTVTISTQLAHGLTVGTVVNIFNFTNGGYNGQFTIASVPTSTTFTYIDAAANLTPSGPGVYSTTSIFNLTQTAANVAGLGTKALQIIVNPPAVPVLLGYSPLTASASVNSPFEYDILAANHPTSYSVVQALPAGLSLNSMTGQITGTPTVAGTYNLTIQASNVGGTGSLPMPQGLTLTINPQQTPIIVSANKVNALIGIPFTYQISATANPTVFAAPGLPANLTFNTSTGLISGTPAAAGVSVIPISASNTIGTGTTNLTITITAPQAPQFTSTNSVNGIDGSPFNYNITATGQGPIYFTAGGLPTGLTLVGTTILGTPTAGVTVVTLTAFSPATNPSVPGGPANPFGVAPPTLQLTLNISPTSASISNSNLTATGTVGVPFTVYYIQATGSAPLNVTTSALPAGLTLVGNSIQGIPTTSAVTLNGPFPVTLTASNAQSVAAGIVATKTLLITINAAKPAFTSPGFALGTDGTPFKYVIAATGTQIITYTATGLPNGLSLSGSVISGTPTSTSIGTSVVQINATNAGGTTNMNLSIEIDPAPPVLTLPASITGSAGVPFSFTIPVTGSPQINFTVPNLPPGLVVDIDKIDGTPTTVGTYNVVVSANNPGGTANQALTIVINPAPPTITAAQITGFDGVPLIPFTLQVTGSQPITYAATNLPKGLSIGVTTGIISGTPLGFGSSAAVVTATNVGGSGSQNIVFNIAPSKPTITGLLIVQATPGVPFTYTITASGSQVITYQVFNLPPGLSVNTSTGVISGTPKGPIGKTSSTIIATNPYGNDQQTLDIDVEQTPPTITNTILQASGQQFAPFTYTVTATGSPPIAYAATSLPAGLTIDSSSGIISGAPTVNGAFNVGISATNLFGTDTGKVLVITVAKSPPKFTSASSVTASLNQPYMFQVVAVGSPSIVYGAKNLPPQLVLDPNTGIISGTPTMTGTFAVSLVATNLAGSDAQTLTINVVANPPTINPPLNVLANLIELFHYQITATGAATITYSVDVNTLPPGLTFSGDTIAGIPTQTGVYNVTLTATNSIGSDVKTLVINVLDDSDGDGFPDDLEIFLGYNPHDPTSNPFIGGKGLTKVLNITAMNVKVNFSSAGQDTITAKGTIELPGNFNAAGQTTIVYVSGVPAKVTLNAKGNSGAPSVSMKPKSTGGTTSYTFSLGKGDFKTKLARVGVVNSDIKTKDAKTVSFLVLLFVDNTLYRSDKVLNYTASKGKFGTAK